MKPESDTLAAGFKSAELAIEDILKIKRETGRLLIVHTAPDESAVEMSLMPSYNLVSLIIKNDHAEVSVTDRLSGLADGVSQTRVFTLGKNH